LAHLIGRQVGKLLHNAVWHVLWKRRYLHNTGCSAAQVTATPSFALELLGLHLTACSKENGGGRRKVAETPENSSHVA
jgi:hypothetical protein